MCRATRRHAEAAMWRFTEEGDCTDASMRDHYEVDHPKDATTLANIIKEEARGWGRVSDSRTAIIERRRGHGHDDDSTVNSGDDSGSEVMMDRHVPLTSLGLPPHRPSLSEERLQYLVYRLVAV
ncbi:hypothetical protein NL676_024177 [Syzygium grande]|nr:hypothetical protein NL676_024177 [Syzygium grande]